jgi:hypothetical protein
MADDSKKQELERTKREIDEILRRVDSMPVLTSITEDEILGYDEHGIPASPSADSLTKERGLS